MLNLWYNISKQFIYCFKILNKKRSGGRSMSYVLMFIGKVVVLAVVMALQLFLLNKLLVKEEAANKRIMLLWYVIVSVIATGFAIMFPVWEAYKVQETVLSIPIAHLVVLGVSLKTMKDDKILIKSLIVPLVMLLELLVYGLYIS